MTYLVGLMLLMAFSKIVTFVSVHCTPQVWNDTLYELHCRVLIVSGTTGVFTVCLSCSIVLLLYNILYGVQ